MVLIARSLPMARLEAEKPILCKEIKEKMQALFKELLFKSLAPILRHRLPKWKKKKAKWSAKTMRVTQTPWSPISSTRNKFSHKSTRFTTKQCKT